MATEKFSLEQFQKALPDGSKDLGIIKGEHVFSVPIDEKVCIHVRSSIDETGYAALSGDDSIRIFLVDAFDSQPIAPKIDAWTTRVAGWETRMNVKIDMLKSYRQQSGNCKVCGEPLRINRGNKPGKFYGKLFASCSNWGHNQFVALKEYNEKEAVRQETFGDKISIPVHSISKELNLKRANQFQREVIETKGKGIINICAGAGSGKTYVLEQTIAGMLMSGINPDRILAVTFSVKAAQEMRGRIAKTIWPDLTPEEFTFFTEGAAKAPENYDFSRTWIEADPIRKFLNDWVCTIHAACFRLLKAYGENIRVPDVSQERQINDIIKDSLAEMDWEESPETIKACIGWAVNDLIDTYSAKLYFQKRLADQDIPEQAPSNLAEIYRRFMKFMDKNGLVNFDMMQARVRQYLREKPDFKYRVQNMFDYVLVDEAQDTDFHQCEIVWTIAEKAANIFFVGDTRQSLYKWRGAEPKVMEDIFDAHWKNVHRLSLPINYRSTQTIVVQSNKMIKLNYVGREQYLFEAAAREDAEPGDPLQYYEYPKINALADDLSRIILETESPGDWFVLSRTRAECAAIHLGLIRNRVPAVNLSGGLLFGTPHIRKVLAYARLAVNWNDARDDLEVLNEVANVASDEFIAPITRRRHLETCRTQDKPWIDCGCPIIMEEGQDRSYVRYYGKQSIEAAHNWSGVMAQRYEKNRGGYPTMASRGATDLVNFVQRVEHFRDDAKEALKFIIDHSVLPWMAHDKGISQDDLGENGEAEDFDVLLSLVEPDNSIEQFLTVVENLSSGGVTGDKESVHLMTVHKSKGSERKYVALNLTRLPIVPPKPKKKAIVVGKPSSIEDERNIAYVGVTRAKERCILVASMDWNGMETQRSPFLNEMDIVFPRDIVTDNKDIVDNKEEL